MIASTGITTYYRAALLRNNLRRFRAVEGALAVLGAALGAAAAAFRGAVSGPRDPAE